MRLEEAAATEEEVVAVEAVAAMLVGALGGVAMAEAEGVAAWCLSS